MNRRQILWTLLTGSLVSMTKTPSLALQIPKKDNFSPINVMIPSSYKDQLPYKKNSNYQYRLAQSILDFISDHYADRALPVWRKRLSAVDMEKRVINIAYWIVRAVEKNSRIYPIDPAWISAQIMTESFFYEFAVSWAFAVGICQFIPRTAKHYGMITADSTKLDHSLLQCPALAKELDRFYALSKKRRHLIQKNKKLFINTESYLRETLLALTGQKEISQAQVALNVLDQAETLRVKITEARKNYRHFLRANFHDKSIFNQRDLSFLNQFDQRVTYKKPIYKMVQMMAEHLKARGGNILVATAGYNAGLPSTASNEYIYRYYGRIPAYSETTNYLSRIVANHHEIVKRL